MNEAYFENEIELLFADITAIVEGQLVMISHLGDVNQPNLEEGTFDQDQLVVLGEIAKVGSPLGELNGALNGRIDQVGQVLPHYDLLHVHTVRTGGAVGEIVTG